MTDVFPICGSGKRSYVVLMGLVQSMSALALGLFSFGNPVWVMLLAMGNNLGGAFMDVVVDGMMVVNSRKDPTSGSEELQAYSWGFYGAGGVVGCTVSGWFLNGLDAEGNPDGHPYICFLVMSFFGFAVAMSGFFIDKSVEENQQEMVKMGFCKRTSFVFSEVKAGLSLKELYSVAIFRTILGCLVPSFSSYLYYY